MHVRELVELAALVSAHGAVLIEGSGRISEAGLREYWSAAKCRLDRWGRTLRWLKEAARQATASAAFSPAVPSRRLSATRRYQNGVLEEILLGEVLTRVWAAVLTAYDRRRSSSEAEPIGRSVFVGQMEMRQRVLDLLLRGPGLSLHDAVELNRLRRRAERWSDLLIGYVLLRDEVSEFAVDAGVAREFSDDFVGHPGWSPGGQAWSLLLAAIRVGCNRDFSQTSPNADLNARIASGILACFPAEMFDSTGLVRSLWMTRLDKATDDAQGLLSDLFNPERTVHDELPGFVVRGRAFRK